MPDPRSIVQNGNSLALVLQCWGHPWLLTIKDRFQVSLGMMRRTEYVGIDCAIPVLSSLHSSAGISISCFLNKQVAITVDIPPNNNHLPPSTGGIHMVVYQHYDPTMCKYKLGLQKMRSLVHQTMPVGPADIERTRSSLGAGVVDHVWAM